ncbi:MAG: rRNA maturation RNase YbeY [Oscillospiraceae bacterium]|nr:rRNA maturation RNase YbeY [Oscillospiraceae bacterium]
MKHQINLLFEGGAARKVVLGLHIRRCIHAALDAEGVDIPCEINVLATDDATIQTINRQTRQVDKPTDVLSFPMFEYAPGAFPKDAAKDADPETGLLPLGDMVLSLERAAAQAKEYGHSLRREVGYLTIHSVLHLLGYDHLDEGPMKRQMRAREERILADIVLPR